MVLASICYYSLYKVVYCLLEEIPSYCIKFTPRESFVC
jgi:hypothetical protein